MSRPQLVTVTGTLTKPDGTPESGSIRFTQSVHVRSSSGDTILAPGTLTAALDATGHFTIDLPCTDDPAWSPQGWTYTVTLALSGSHSSYSVQLSLADPVQELADLLPVVATAGTLYAPVAHTHAQYALDADLDALSASVVGLASIPAATTGVALQAAITAAEALTPPGRVWVPPGTYTLASSLVITKPGLVLEGPGKLVAGVGFTDYMIKFVPANGVRMDRVRIAGLTIDCNATASGIDALGAAHCRFENLEIKRHYNYAIGIHQDNLGGYGHHNVVRDCRLHLGTDGAAGGGLGTAIIVWSSDENTVEGCTLESNGSGLNNGAHIYEVAGLNSFIGNEFVGNPNVASVEFIKATGSNNKIIGNTFDGGTNAQVELAGNDCTVAGNQFYRPAANSDCVLISGQGNTLVGNQFSSHATNGQSRHAINAGSASGANYYSANMVRTNGTWSGANYNGGAGKLEIPVEVAAGDAAVLFTASQAYDIASAVRTDFDAYVAAHP